MKEGENGEEKENGGNGVPQQKKQGGAPVSQWMHPPDALIKGCCNYTSSVSIQNNGGLFATGLA